MWYFSWILGVGLAVGFGVLNGLWHEFHLFDEGDQACRSMRRKKAMSLSSPAAPA